MYLVNPVRALVYPRRISKYSGVRGCGLSVPKTVGVPSVHRRYKGDEPWRSGGEIVRTAPASQANIPLTQYLASSPSCFAPYSTCSLLSWPGFVYAYVLPHGVDAPVPRAYEERYLKLYGNYIIRALHIGIEFMVLVVSCTCRDIYMTRAPSDQNVHKADPSRTSPSFLRHVGFALAA